MSGKNNWIDEWPATTRQGESRMLLTPLQLKSKLVNFFVNLVKCDPYLITPEPSYSHFGLLGEHDPNCVLLDPAGHILVDLVKPDPKFVPPWPSRSHFSWLGHIWYTFCPCWTQLVTFWSVWSNTMPISFLLDPGRYILFDFAKQDPNFVPPWRNWLYFGWLGPTQSTQSKLCPPGPSCLHFGQLGQTQYQFRSSWTQLVTFWSAWLNTIPISSSLDPAGHILDNLDKHDLNFVPPGPSWSHFGQLGQIMILNMSPRDPAAYIPPNSRGPGPSW
jgi:hypothetical protein